MSVKPIDLGAFLHEKESPLAGHLSALHSAANKNRIDPRFLVAVAGAESAYGKVSHGHNAWGIGPGRQYASWPDGFDAAATLLRRYYVGEGRKSVSAIGSKWAPIAASNDPRNLNSNWTRNVSAIYSSLGGDPNDVTKGWRKSAAPAQVAKLPSVQAGYLPPPSADLLPGMGAFAPSTRSLEQTAFENLGRIGRGESPTRTLKAFVDASLQEESSRAAARMQTRELEPKPVATASPAEDKPTKTKPARTLSPGGGWGGSYSIAKALAQMAFANGLKAVSEKRDRKATASGGVSDHWVGSTDAYAFDLSNGGAPTAEMDKTAQAIAASLGVSYDGKSELVLTTRSNGYRIQVLYRTQVGGNHNDHVHVGVRRA